MVRPSALAVLRLITSSNRVARSTGSSLGLVPARIFAISSPLCACYSLEDYLPRYRTEAAAITQAMPMGVSRQAAVYAGASVTAQRPI
jgi:hypothetical protein